MIEKQCSKCGTSKPVSEFYVSRILKSGYRSNCKVCELDGAAARARDWHHKNKERASASSKAYREKNKESVAEANKKWIAENKEQSLAIKKRYRDKNKEKLAEAQKKRFEESPAKRKQTVAKWMSANPDKTRMGTANRRAKIKKAKVSFDSDFDALVISEAYALATLRQRLVGGVWHVDHVEPIRGDDVCGLHNGFNMSVVPAAYNRWKSNLRVDEHWITAMTKMNKPPSVAFFTP